MKKIALVMELVKLGGAIGELIINYKNAETETEKAFVLMEANNLKNEYAKKIITEDFPIESYEVMFKVDEANETKKHFIELYYLEGNNA